MNINSQPSSKELKEAIFRLTKGLQGKGFTLKKLYPYTNQNGEVIYWRILLKHKDGKKLILPLSKTVLGYHLKEPIFTDGKPLYRMPDLPEDLSETVFLVEGENCANVLSELGLVATTSGGASSAEGADWTPLKDRRVIIWPDNDKAGNEYARRVLKELEALNCDVYLIEVGKISLPEKGDCVDYLELHPAATKSDIESLPMVRHESNQEEVWQDPEQIKTELYPVAPFELDMLPEAFREWISDAALRMQCPPDFIAAAVMTMLGSLIGTRCSIRPKEFDDDWMVVPNLWGGVVGCPSTLKTPALQEALKPLASLESTAKDNFDSQAHQYETEQVVFEAKRDSLKAEMKKSAGQSKNSRSMDHITEDYTNLLEPEEPTMHRYKTNDATVEKLSELLNENPHGLLLFRDEMVGLLATWEKPGRESDRAFFLEAWGGTGSHTTDRIGRGTIFTSVVCLSLFGGIQPSKLAGYLYLIQNGLQNDGLFQRLQLLVYPDENKKWELIDKKPDHTARNRAFKIIEELASINFDDVGAGVDFSSSFSFFKFSPDAQQIFNAWLTDLELKKLRVDDHPLILEHLGKYRSLMPTLALIFHLIDVADGGTQGPVSSEAAEKAVAWCKYLETHARRVYGLVSDIGQQAALKLAEKIKEVKLSDGFTVRDIYRRNWNLLNDKDIARDACDELVEARWLKEEVTGPSFGQKRKVEYFINPKIFDTS